MKKILLLTVFVFAAACYGQNAESRNNAIKANFSQAALGAWQQHSLDKVRDYFQYLELLANETSSEPLKAQLKESIYTLFEARNTMVIDITSADKTPMTLENLLEKMDKFKRPLKINIKKKRLSSYFSDNYWMNIYTIEITVDNNTMINDVSQKIYFLPQIKDFGGKSKEVWSLKLGEME
ncbi:MAG: hypothetical protein CFE23_15955 [Flavobacterium sp. BFFFF1]|uniref:hypothetical protein n=1 Tax=Flavobacterium sp. BFFFF1 TaxID=2015557 RepID=UPI000BCE3456|nr:hypothetical protein [Flavobacterium sp. BFFFF1]OYU79038.1 MAG: hypothetical protein CFE23_15955 [Flavobacterium sp. BFFFF1]